MMEENKINGNFSAKNGIGVYVSKIHDAGDDTFLSLSSTTRIGNGTDNNDGYLGKLCLKNIPWEPPCYTGRQEFLLKVV